MPMKWAFIIIGVAVLLAALADPSDREASGNVYSSIAVTLADAGEDGLRECADADEEDDDFQHFSAEDRDFYVNLRDEQVCLFEDGEVTQAFAISSPRIATHRFTSGTDQDGPFWLFESIPANANRR